MTNTPTTNPAVRRTRADWRSLAKAALLIAPLCAVLPAHAESSCIPGPGDRPETGLQGAVPLAERQAPGGFQGFWCGARKVGQNLLYNRGAYGSTAQIGNCVYASMRNPSDLAAPTTGTAVIDVRVPSDPKIVGMLRTPAMIRAYSALYIENNIMVGAFKDFGPNGTNPVDFYDVSGDCLQPRYLSTIDVASGNHDGWITRDGGTYYGVPFGGADVIADPNRVDIHVTDSRDPTQPARLINWNRRELPPDIYERVKGTRNFHDASTNRDGTRLYLALYGGVSPLGGGGGEAGRCANGLMILDSTEVAKRVTDPHLKFVSFTSWCDEKQQIDPDFGDGSTAAAHATEYVIHQNGKEYVVTTDESGGGLNGSAAGICAQRTYGRIIDISDDKHPQVVGTFKPDVNKPENCAANLAADTNGGMVHYIGFDDRYHMRLAFYAAANQGVRVVDWADPAHPREIAYYVSPNAPTTAPGETDFTRPDIAYTSATCMLQSGWNQGGLITLELTDPAYNPCMRRSVSGGGWLGGAGNDKVHVSVEVARAGSGIVGAVDLGDAGAKLKIRVDHLTMLGTVHDACGAVPGTNAVQMEGSGTYNGAPASFRVCVQDNGQGGGSARTPDLFHLACTAGCAYQVAGAIGGGNLQVRSQP